MKRVSLGIGGMQAARKHHSWSPGRGRGPLDYGAATHNKTEKSWTGWRRLSCPWILQTMYGIGWSLFDWHARHLVAHGGPAGPQAPALLYMPAYIYTLRPCMWPAVRAEMPGPPCTCIPRRRGCQARRLVRRPEHKDGVSRTGHPSISCCVWLQIAVARRSEWPLMLQLFYCTYGRKAPAASMCSVLGAPWPGMELLTEPDTQLVPYGSRPSHLLGRSGLQLRSTMELLPGLGKLAVDGARRLGA
ncbi:hypothetical protein V8C44DRAFT_335729 [Trichoderma aethiopicum]